MTVKYECDRCGNVVQEAAKILMVRHPVNNAQNLDGPDLCFPCVQEYQDFLHEVKATNSETEEAHSHG